VKKRVREPSRGGLNTPRARLSISTVENAGERSVVGGFSTREKMRSCGLLERARRLLSLRIGALVSESVVA
jgi:hypothetical protein